MPDNPIHVAGGVIIKNKKVLAVRARNRPSFMVPGGKIESEETPQRALVRELKEELGISIQEKDLKPYMVVNEDAALDGDNVGRLVRMDTFIVERWQSEPKPTGESDEIAWLDHSALENTRISNILELHILPSLKNAGLID